MTGRNFVRQEGIVLMALDFKVCGRFVVTRLWRIAGLVPFVLWILAAKDFANCGGGGFRPMSGDRRCGLTLGAKCGRMPPF
jgi:hypothetical protein